MCYVWDCPRFKSKNIEENLRERKGGKRKKKTFNLSIILRPISCYFELGKKKENINEDIKIYLKFLIWETKKNHLCIKKLPYLSTLECFDITDSTCWANFSISKADLLIIGASCFCGRLFVKAETVDNRSRKVLNAWLWGNIISNP